MCSDKLYKIIIAIIIICLILGLMCILGRREKFSCSDNDNTEWCENLSPTHKTCYKYYNQRLKSKVCYSGWKLVKKETMTYSPEYII